MTKRKERWACQRCTVLDTAIPRATPRSAICCACDRELKQKGQQWCTRCQQAKPIAVFRDRYCKDCKRAQGQAWRAAHPGYTEAYNQAYHAAHREEMIAASRAYYEANRETVKAQKQAYYEANRETIKAKARAYRPHRPASSIAKERARQRERKAVYRRNERAARLRRIVARLQAFRAAD